MVEDHPKGNWVSAYLCITKLRSPGKICLTLDLKGFSRYASYRKFKMEHIELERKQVKSNTLVCGNQCEGCFLIHSY